MMMIVNIWVLMGCQELLQILHGIISIARIISFPDGKTEVAWLWGICLWLHNYMFMCWFSILKPVAIPSPLPASQIVFSAFCDVIQMRDCLIGLCKVCHPTGWPAPMEGSFSCARQMLRVFSHLLASMCQIRLSSHWPSPFASRSVDKGICPSRMGVLI